MAHDWDDRLCVFLHDPPDKALSLGDHEPRTKAYLEAALGRTVDEETLKKLGARADTVVAIAERPPMPSDGTHQVDYAGHVCHPLDPSPLNWPAAIDVDATKRHISAIVHDLDARGRFLSLWRFLPDRLPHCARLPAETRAPDHTIWNHLDIAAGVRAARMDRNDGAFLSFQLGPVQTFVVGARSVRDLWTGSAILSWLTFRAMGPIIEELGPTALVFPSLRGAPLMDGWLRQQGLDGFPELDPKPEAAKAPSMPNRFLALVPWGDDGREARRLATACEDAARQAWKTLACAVKAKLDPDLSALCSRWDARWDDQVNSYFDGRVVVMAAVREPKEEVVLAKAIGCDSFADVWPDAGKLRQFGAVVRKPAGRPPQLGRWQVQVEMAGRLMEASRAMRHVPPSTVHSATGDYPNKCTLFGSFEQMGPDDLRASAEFWKLAAQRVEIAGVRLGTRDRFCAVALTKRFAAPAFLAGALGLTASDLRIPDTWTVAAALWLQRAGLAWTSFRGEGGQRWNGQWLHWRGQHDDRDEDRVPDATWQEIIAARERMTPSTPRVYYAILKMDADQIGAWLRGDNAPRVRDILHPETRAHFEALEDTATVTAGLDAKRPVGPALHAAISEALANFAVHVVPAVVARHAGTVIYAGGDDLLALLPVETAMCCAWELRQAFSGSPAANGGTDPGYYRTAEGRDLLMMGQRATLSAGLAVLHAKDDLREGLASARAAEKQAKDGGRDALVVTVQRRSGEQTSALACWNTVDWMEKLREAFAAGASDRWAYRLRGEEPTLGSLPQAAVLAEVRRQVDRSEEATRARLGGGDKDKAGRRIAGGFEAYERMRLTRCKVKANADALRAKLFADFLTLCQSASFLARGRD